MSLINLLESSFEDDGENINNTELQKLLKAIVAHLSIEKEVEQEIDGAADEAKIQEIQELNEILNKLRPPDEMQENIKELQDKVYNLHRKVFPKRCDRADTVALIPIVDAMKLDICKLHRASYALQQQSDDLVECYSVAKTNIVRIQEQLKELRHIETLRKNQRILFEWKDSFANDLAVFLERIEYLKMVKANWLDVKTLMDKKVDRVCLEQNYVSKKQLNSEKLNVIAEFEKLHNLFKEFFEVQCKRFACVEKSIEDLRDQLKQLVGLRKLKKNPAFIDCNCLK